MMQAQVTLTQNPPYILGHAETELDRLIHQARFFGDLTRHVLNLAGLGPGMRVLDAGCGAGDVSFMAVRMVGPKGEVIGVDKSPEAVALASQRALAAGLTNVHFVTQDLAELHLDEPVDALIGSRILMYFADPAVALRRLAGFVKPGGLVVFQDFDMEAAKSEPACALFETTLRRVKQTFTRAGFDIQCGLKLSRIFQEAGLTAPQMILGARVETGPDALVYDQLAQVTRSLLPVMERTGIATAAEVGIETLADRIRDDALANNSTLVSPALIGAWTRKNLGVS
ncbi:MAG: methyltransferase domain-containing protein [Anaerolineae bacterium]|nr:methyltransferase domain-containing protein [Anaerolineae bacterium]